MNLTSVVHYTPVAYSVGSRVPPRGHMYMYVYPYVGSREQTIFFGGEGGVLGWLGGSRSAPWPPRIQTVSRHRADCKRRLQPTRSGAGPREAANGVFPTHATPLQRLKFCYVNSIGPGWGGKEERGGEGEGLAGTIVEGERREKGISTARWHQEREKEGKRDREQRDGHQPRVVSFLPCLFSIG
ncbi:hypothetical protein L209DRAFT_165240 [Thermothelomyces heterothallicus CBS 203.75]